MKAGRGRKDRPRKMDAATLERRERKAISDALYLEKMLVGCEGLGDQGYDDVFELAMEELDRSPTDDPNAAITIRSARMLDALADQSVLTAVITMKSLTRADVLNLSRVLKPTATVSFELGDN
jgi:hypothetical protein